MKTTFVDRIEKERIESSTEYKTDLDEVSPYEDLTSSDKYKIASRPQVKPVILSQLSPAQLVMTTGGADQDEVLANNVNTNFTNWSNTVATSAPVAVKSDKCTKAVAKINQKTKGKRYRGA